MDWIRRGVFLPQHWNVADVRAAVLHHHERFDGSGYVRGLKGEEMPLWDASWLW